MKIHFSAIVISLLAVGVGCQNEAPTTARSGGAGSSGRETAEPGGAEGTRARGGAGGSSVDGVADCCAGGGAPPQKTACAGPSIGVNQLTSSSVAPAGEVHLSELIATSQKFLVFRSSAGSCLWGVFVSEDVSVAAPGTGLLIVSYGDAAGDASAGACPTGTDAIPDDVRSGDVLEAHGKTSSFVSSSCSRPIAPQFQLRASKACPLLRSGHRAPPAPAELDFSTADRIATASEPNLLQAWGNLLVRLQAVSGRPADAGSIVGRFGVVRLNETLLEVHDELYWNDLSAGGPGAFGKQPVFGAGTSFSRIDGILHLDFCSWSLNPRNKCSDFEPKSENCP